MVDALAAGFLLAGGMFCLIAGIGVLRFGDTYMRMHASTKAGTLGLALILVAVMLEADSSHEIVEALFVFLFMIATAPIGSHLVGRAAFRTHQTVVAATRSDSDAEEFRPR